MISRIGQAYKLKLVPLCLVLSGCAQRYAVRGMILQIDQNAGTVTISHRDIPNYMPAMAMAFRARRPEEMAALHPGEQVEFRLVVGKSASHVERLRRIERADQDFRLPSNPERVAIGAAMPDFAL